VLLDFAQAKIAETMSGTALQAWAKQYWSFLRIGHFLFAFLAGLAGGMVAVGLDARRERGETA
jgi:hypothetical protein